MPPLSTRSRMRLHRCSPPSASYFCCLVLPLALLLALALVLVLLLLVSVALHLSPPLRLRLVVVHHHLHLHLHTHLTPRHSRFSNPKRTRIPSVPPPSLPPRSTPPVPACWPGSSLANRGRASSLTQNYRQPPIHPDSVWSMGFCCMPSRSS